MTVKEIVEKHRAFYEECRSDIEAYAKSGNVLAKRVKELFDG